MDPEMDRQTNNSKPGWILKQNDRQMNSNPGCMLIIIDR